MTCGARASRKEKKRKGEGRCGLLHARLAWAVELAHGGNGWAEPGRFCPVCMFFLFYFLFSFPILVLGL
jgi:hypothetical protein